MIVPKLHHYVPQFYLNYFSTKDSRLWVWDKKEDRTFCSTAKNLACESNFYLLDGFISSSELNPLEMEIQFSEVESAAAMIFAKIFMESRITPFGQKLKISKGERSSLALYIALQFLRTADTREIIGLLSLGKQEIMVEPNELGALHASILWDQKVLDSFVTYLIGGVWTFAKNETGSKFATSDNPVCFRTKDNSMWRKANILGDGTYVVFPLNPELILYVYPKHQKYVNLRKFNNCISPVIFTANMVENENTGQAFMSSRFVISDNSDFEKIRSFAATIGTDRYKR